MPIAIGISVEAAPGDLPWLQPSLRGAKLYPDSLDLVHVYETDAKQLAEADWAYLQVVMDAYQVHPATVAELAMLGPVGAPNAQRWTVEGPLMDRPGDPGLGNCTMLVEVAHSLDLDPGSNWIAYKPGRYRLRSVKARVTITRPALGYSFRVLKLALLATRAATPQRPRRVHAGISDLIPSGMCRIVSRDFEVAGALEIADDAILEIT